MPTASSRARANALRRATHSPLLAVRGRRGPWSKPGAATGATSQRDGLAQPQRAVLAAAAPRHLLTRSVASSLTSFQKERSPRPEGGGFAKLTACVAL